MTGVKRNADGTFAPGITGNPKGGSKKRKDYLHMLQEECTPAKWKAICVKALSQAGEGDKAARKWVADYLLGRPVQRVKAEVETRSMLDARWIRDINRAYGDAANGPEDELPQDSD